VSDKLKPSERLSQILKASGIGVLAYNPDKDPHRPITPSKGRKVSVEEFRELVLKNLSGTAYLDLNEQGVDVKFLRDQEKFHKALKFYCQQNGLVVKPKEALTKKPKFREPSEIEKLVEEMDNPYKNLQLNVDVENNGATRDLTYMVTERANDRLTKLHPMVYIKSYALKEPEAFELARKVFTTYNPRPTIYGLEEVTDEMYGTKSILNTYVPPKWESVPRKLVKDRLPLEFKKLIYHLFPIAEEREYFFSWLYYSLFERSYIYLILCGPGGIGKNTLKEILRALHGHTNTVDGKRSTLVDRFNSQLDKATLAWFDELKYNEEMENVMKEIQNDTISIERKGVDATSGTKIYASMVVSNNKPRDNFIDFEARKFAPLKMTKKRLEAVFTPRQIDELLKKVKDPESPTFDKKFLAQIAYWVKDHGKSPKWPTLEYRGPMFWALAHTSMARWKKKSVDVMISLKTNNALQNQIDEEGWILWSALEANILKKNTDRSIKFPDYSTVKHFFECFRDSQGKKVFKTRGVPKSVIGDFWVRATMSISVFTDNLDIVHNKKDEPEKPKGSKVYE
jgi:hypothetical protein